MITLGNAEKEQLRNALDGQLVRRAMQEALMSVYRESAGAATLEQCAMAYNRTEGARLVLNKLLALAEIREEVSPTPNSRKFRPTYDG